MSAFPRIARAPARVPGVPCPRELDVVGVAGDPLQDLPRPVRRHVVEGVDAIEVREDVAERTRDVAVLVTDENGADELDGPAGHGEDGNRGRPGGGRYGAAMHRNRTKLAARAHAVGTRIERRGVVATYKLHDRVGANRASRRRFAEGRPRARRDAAADRRRAPDGGLPRPSVRGAVPGPRRVAAVEADGKRFVAETEAGLAAEAAGEDRDSAGRRRSSWCARTRTARRSASRTPGCTSASARDARRRQLVLRPLVEARPTSTSGTRRRRTPGVERCRRSAGTATTTTSSSQGLHLPHDVDERRAARVRPGSTLGGNTATSGRGGRSATTSIRRRTSSTKRSAVGPSRPSRRPRGR